VSIGGWDDQRKPYIYVDFGCGTWGGRPWADGLQGNANMFANMASQSVEVIETEQPLQILAYEFVPDRAGAGKYRGGAPYRRTYRFLEREAVLQVRSDRRKIRPWGLWGGDPGQPSCNMFTVSGGEEQILDSKLTMTIRHGDIFTHDLAGGGGWGDPLERDPEMVLADVRNELVSPEAAARSYGVVVDTTTLSVDRAASEARRAEIRAARPPGELASITWQDGGGTDQEAGA
jgi:N-methylhydantoinase B